MTDQEIFDKIKDITIAVLPQMANEEITMDTVINRDLGVDSLSFIMLICKIEGAFDIEIPDAKWKKITKMGELVKCVKQLQSKTKS